MSNHVWGSDPGFAVDTHGGGKVVGEYFGLHKAKIESNAITLDQKKGLTAQQHVDDSKRLTLNGGEPFSGTLVSRRVDHVTLHIGYHQDHGLSAHVDRPTSHSNGGIEVVTSQIDGPIVIARSEFYSRLLDQEIPNQTIEELCHKFWNV